MAFCCSNVQIMVLLCRNRGTLYRCLEKRVQCPRICRKSFIQTQPLIASLCWPHKQILMYTLAPLTVCTGCHKQKKLSELSDFNSTDYGCVLESPLESCDRHSVVCIFWVFLAHLRRLLKAEPLCSCKKSRMWALQIMQSKGMGGCCTYYISDR